MSRLIQRLKRSFRLGKEKHFVGVDLANNSYYERPPAEGMWARTRRVVDFAEHKDYARYRFEDMPPQWAAWLRHTRSNPPSLMELEVDVVRQQKLSANVQRLENAYAEERLRRPGLAKPDPTTTFDLPPIADGSQNEQTMVDPAALLAPGLQRGPTSDSRAYPVPSSQPARTPPPLAEPTAPDLLQEEGKEQMRARSQRELNKPGKPAASSGPDENWSPEAWSPSPAARR